MAGPTKHVAALDGLRGVAVAAVVAYHLRPEWVPGGFLGVDLFFVLSGYLITSLLLAERERTGRIDLLAFAGRRFRRLLPAVVLVVLAVAAWAAIDGDAAEIERVRRHGWAALVYVANWVFIADGDSYFTDFSSPSPLRHVWSLAIEEQFYLLWPLTLFALHRLGGRRLVGIGALVLAAASAAWMAILFDGGDPSRVYFGTDTRIFEPLAGAAVAVVLPLGRARHRSWASVGAIAAVIWLAAVLVVDDAWTGFYEGGALVLAVVGVLVVVAATTGGPLVSVLEASPLVALGVISYGVYLWHWPIAVVADREGWSGAAGDVGVVALTLVVSTVSYVAVERPVRRGFGTRSAGWRPVIAGLTVMALAAGTVGVLTRTDPAPGTSVETVLAELTEDPGEQAPDVPDESAPDGADASEEPGVGAPLRVVLIGDSAAWTLGGGGIYFSEDHGPYESPFDPDEIVLVNLARKGYRLVPGATTDLGGVREPPEENVEHEDWWRATVATVEADLVVALFGFTDLQSRLVDGEEVEFGSPEFDELLSTAAVDLLGDLAAGAPVVVLASPSMLPGDQLGPDTEAFLAEHGVDRVVHLNSVLGEVAAELPGVSTIDFGGWMCPTPETCVRDVDGEALRSDGVHFTPAGAGVAAEWLTGPLTAAVGA